ncbi:hypothetical protein [Brucella gallinifaecis]|uniref:hypothetical protein n=1 Tax=Brucella gallinifaecis TaxID=215590 RepID=UPI00235E1CFA|nr:hypothetical protein [Brucella gallinifaecis]
MLASVNGRATRWIISKVSEVRIATDKAEQQFTNASLPQKDRIGATVIAYGDAPDGPAYKYGVDSTRIHLRRYADGWRVMRAARISLYPKDSRASKTKVSLSAACIEKIKGIAVCDFALQPEKAAS